MFDQLDSEERPARDEDPVTLGEAAGVYFLILLEAFVSLLAFISLRDQPHGMQIASLISYTGALFVLTFFRTKGVKTKHSLDEPYVQEQFPQLLGVHCIYLVTVYFVVGSAFSIRSSLPAWWLHSRGAKDMPPIDAALMLVIGGLGLSQVVLSRRILGRAKKREQAISTGE